MRRSSSAVAMPFSVTSSGTLPASSQARRTEIPRASGRYAQPVIVLFSLCGCGFRPFGPTVLLVRLNADEVVVAGNVKVEALPLVVHSLEDVFVAGCRFEGLLHDRPSDPGARVLVKDIGGRTVRVC